MTAAIDSLSRIEAITSYLNKKRVIKYALTKKQKKILNTVSIDEGELQKKLIEYNAIPRKA